MKLKKSDINIIIMLVGVLLAVFSYVYVYQTYTEKTEELKTQNAKLQSEVDALQQLADNKEFYISETERMNGEIEDIISYYPSDVRTEDKIMYIVGLENEYGDKLFKVNSFAVANAQIISVAVTSSTSDDTETETGDAVAADTATTTSSEDDLTAVVLYEHPMTLTFDVTYQSIKDIVYGLLNDENAMSLTSLTLAYSADTGCLSGTMVANTYSMDGTGKEYTEPTVSGVLLGVPDVFNSGSEITKIVTETASTDSEEE